MRVVRVNKIIDKLFKLNLSQLDQDTLEPFISLLEEYDICQFVANRMTCQPNIVKPLLEFIYSYQALFHWQKNFQEIFLKGVGKEGTTLLMLASKTEFMALMPLLSFMNEHSELMDRETIQKIFLQTDKQSGMNALMSIVSCKGAEVMHLLDFIGKHSGLFDQETLRDMFLKKNKQGKNPLLQAVYSKEATPALEPLLDFIGKHSELIGRKTIQKIFLERYKDSYEDSTLLSLAAFSSRKLKSLLRFIVKHRALFDQGTIQKMLFQRLLGGGTFVSLIATPREPNKQPDLPVFLLAFIDECITRLDLTAMKKLFVSAELKDLIGWNAAIATLALKKYLDEFSGRQEENINHTPRLFKSIFKKNVCSLEKEQAALMLKAMLESNTCSMASLLRLKEKHPALKQGRLGLLFDVFYKSVARGNYKFHRGVKLLSAAHTHELQQSEYVYRR